MLAVSTIESSGIPSPGGSDFMLLFLTIARPMDAFWFAVCATVGSLIGSAIFYEITRRGGERYLVRITQTGRGARFRTWFLRYGLVTVFIPAFLPIPGLPFKVFAACAGAMGVGRVRFMTVLAAARIPRFAGLAYLGAQLGENSYAWPKSHIWQLLSVAVLLFVASYVLIRWVDRERLQ